MQTFLCSICTGNRQPIQGVTHHIRTEVQGFEVGERQYVAAVVDPPWYATEIRSWISWTSRFLAGRGQLIMSIWPTGVRPLEAIEFEELRGWIEGWADVEILPLIPHYERPPFERAAFRASEVGFLASPGVGRLLRISPNSVPTLTAIAERRSRWLRFTLDGYQLALRFNDTIKPHHFLRVPNAKNWVWPHVSKRAPGRENIGLWSSRNEVAMVGNPHSLANCLRVAFNSSNVKTFEESLAGYPELLSWDIPRPAYRRMIEWNHQQ
jgi:hypothetical protein